MTKKLELSIENLAIVCAILKKNLPQDARVWAFGSRVKNKARPFSDLDLVINLKDKPLPYDLLTILLDEFEESDLPFKVDIVDWNTIDGVFKGIIDRDRVAVDF
jgi:predicted nucleotidyltransferase